MIRLALLAALATAAPSPAQVAPRSAPADDSATTRPENPPSGDEATDTIIVTGRTPRQERLYTENFVTEVGDPTSRFYTLARWSGNLCVGVGNLPPDTAQFYADRVSLVAADVGLRVGEPGCRPNLLITFTTDGPAMAKGLLQQYARSFFPVGLADGATQGAAALTEFTSSAAPVRWWQATALFDRNNQLVTQDLSHGRRKRPVEQNYARIRVPPSSVLLTAYVVVDTSKTGSVTRGQLADYIAMVALSQVDPGVNAAAYDSILNVFGERRSSVLGLTGWDRSYLRALYASNDKVDPNTQRIRIARMMMQSASGE